MHHHTQSPSHAGARGVADGGYRGGVRRQNGRLSQAPASNWETTAPALSYGVEPSRSPSCPGESKLVQHASRCDCSNRQDKRGEQAQSGRAEG